MVPENCPACFESPKERYRIKCLLATQEALFPILFQNLTKTLVPLMEPRVEDFLRLRREAYGRTGGNPHVPPPLPPPSEQQEEAARRAQVSRPRPCRFNRAVVGRKTGGPPRNIRLAAFLSLIHI